MKPEARERIAVQVKAVAVAWTVEYVEAADIDACGMTASLLLAFRRAVAHIEEAGVHPDVVLLDGNPLRLDEREVNVVKGDGRAPPSRRPPSWRRWSATRSCAATPRSIPSTGSTPARAMRARRTSRPSSATG